MTVSTDSNQNIMLLVSAFFTYSSFKNGSPPPALTKPQTIPHKRIHTPPDGATRINFSLKVICQFLSKRTAKRHDMTSTYQGRLNKNLDQEHRHSAINDNGDVAARSCNYFSNYQGRSEPGVYIIQQIYADMTPF